MKFYAGIGSRETPKEILEVMENVAHKLFLEGWTLRSGHAEGADRAFEKGANDLNSEIYLPWPAFGQVPYLEDQGMDVIGRPIYNKKLWEENYKILVSSKIRYNSSRSPIIMLHGRNVAQVMGEYKDPKTYCKFVIAYCRVHNSVRLGGTATAIELAEFLKIPVFNVYFKDNLTKILKYIEK